MGGGVFFSVIFYLTAAIAVAAALLVVIHRNPVKSALALVVCFFAVAVDYVLLQAHFLAVVQVLLYAGAVLVLFLMIIMLLNLGEETKAARRITVPKLLGVAAVALISLVLAASIFAYGRVARLPASQDPDKLAVLLIALGEDPDNISVKPSEFAVNSSTAAERAALASEVLLYMLTPAGRATFQMPPEQARLMTEEKLPELFSTLAKQISRNGDLDKIEVIANFPSLNRGQLQQFVRAAVRARLDQFVKLGTTESVGSALFRRWVLPFELCGLLLLSAILGVLLLAKRNPEGGTT